MDEALAYYRAAAEDFKEVMKPEYGRALFKMVIQENPTILLMESCLMERMSTAMR